MVWKTAKGTDYLARSAYDKSGIRRQTSLGPRSPQTERTKDEYESGRIAAVARFKETDAVLTRQAAVNRALGLGRLPLSAARILRSINSAGLLGNGVRVVGTNAIYAYEAAAGVLVDPGITATADIDLLFDSRQSIDFVVSDDVPERSLMKVVRQFDKTFMRTEHEYSAQNAEGYMVDLIKPMRNPPWKVDIASIGAPGADELVAAEIEGLIWLENAPSFESVAIDEKGVPVTIVTVDPRAWAVHKFWLSQRDGRDPIKMRRDEEQAAIVATIVRDHFPHLAFSPRDLRMIPMDVVTAATHLFE